MSKKTFVKLAKKIVAKNSLSALNNVLCDETGDHVTNLKTYIIRKTNENEKTKCVSFQDYQTGVDIESMKSGNFPVIENNKEIFSFHLSADEIKSILQIPKNFPLCGDEARYFIRCYHFYFSDKQLFVEITDGKYLYEKKISDYKEYTGPKNYEFLLGFEKVFPHIPVTDYKVIVAEKNRITFESEEFIFSFLLVDGRFPKTSNVFNSVDFNQPEDLGIDLKKLAFLKNLYETRKGYKPVHFIDNAVVVDANNDDKIIGIENKSTVQNLSFNFDYLYSLFSVKQDDTKISICDYGDGNAICYKDYNKRLVIRSMSKREDYYTEKINNMKKIIDYNPLSVKAPRKKKTVKRYTDNEIQAVVKDLSYYVLNIEGVLKKNPSLIPHIHKLIKLCEGEKNNV